MFLLAIPSLDHGSLFFHLQMSHNFYWMMNILYKRTLAKEVNISKRCHISSVRLRTWRARFIWYVVRLDLNFVSVLIQFSTGFKCFERGQFFPSADLRIWAPDRVQRFLAYPKMPVFQAIGDISLLYGLAARVTGKLSGSTPILLKCESLEWLFPPVWSLKAHSASDALSALLPCPPSLEGTCLPLG